MSTSEPENEIQSLSQRELRNEAAAATLNIARPAKRVGGWAALRPRRSPDDRSMSEIIDELRQDRA